MKSILLFLFITLSIITFSQTKFDFTASCKVLSQQNKLSFDESAISPTPKYSAEYGKKAKRLKIAGAVFTGIGSAGLLGTSIMTGILTHSLNNQSSSTNKEFAEVGVIVPALLGYFPSAICLGIGLPPLIIGINKTKKYKKSISK